VVFAALSNIGNAIGSWLKSQSISTEVVVSRVPGPREAGPVRTTESALHRAPQHV